MDTKEASIDTSEVQPAAPAVIKYSVFTTTEKWCIVCMASYAAWFSTLSSFIYFPAIPLLSDTLGVSVDKINLTVTTYLAIATIAPTLVGDAADMLGRRPIYVGILALYIVANIAIALAESYPALLGLRILQALAISGTVSVAYGVVADVASPAERGSFVSLVSFALTIAPSIGPVLGGSLAFAAGWTWIFWFLAIAAGLCLVVIILFLPETSRKLVGNGSIAPVKKLRLPIPKIMRHWDEDQVMTGQRWWQMPNPLNSLKILLRKDNAVIITACGLVYAVYTCLNTSFAILFTDIYGLNQWQVGLTYLPFGLGGTVSTLFSGPLLDGAYRKARTERGLSTDKVGGDDLDDFPIEKARLRVMWIPMVVLVAVVVAYGWTLNYHQHIAIPLVLQFVAGLVMQLHFSIYNTLLVDKNQQSPAAAQASSNIVRCTLAAISVAFLQDMIDAMGIGWTFTLMAGFCLLAALLFLVDYHYGTSWRQASLASSSRREPNSNPV